MAFLYFGEMFCELVTPVYLEPLDKKKTDLKTKIVIEETDPCGNDLIIFQRFISLRKHKL